VNGSPSAITTLTSVDRKHETDSSDKIIPYPPRTDMRPNRLESIIRRMPDQQLFNLCISACLCLYFRLSDRLKLLIARRTKLYSKAYRENPSVLVYIPSYNRCEYLLSRSLPSVLAQTYKNIEVVVIDDGSNDQTRETIEKMFEGKVKVVTNERENYRYPNVSLYHWFAGPVDAANLALKLSRCEWIARIDDDDEWQAHHIERAIDHLLQSKSEFYSADYLTFTHDNQIIQRISKDTESGIGGTQTWVYNGALNKIRYNMHCWRKTTNRVNDTDIQDRFYRAGVKITHQDLIACIIRPRDDETEIGSKAYLESPEKYEEFYT